MQAKAVFGLGCLVFGVIFLAAGASQAELLGLTLTHFPRVWADQVKVSYYADGSSYGAPAGCGYMIIDAKWGPAELYEEDNSTYLDIYEGVFHIEAAINRTTRHAVSGSLEVTGDPYGSVETLFSGQLSQTRTNFGFGGNDILEFAFTQQGSGLAPSGEYVALKIFGTSIPDSLFAPGVEPTFLVDFANNGNGLGNAWYLPEPATCALLALGALALLRRR